MEQLELFEDGPQPIQRWLHVWSEAERERRIKNPSTVRPYTCAGENPPERAEETAERAIRLLPQSDKGLGAIHGE